MVLSALSLTGCTKKEKPEDTKGKEAVATEVENQGEVASEGESEVAISFDKIDLIDDNYRNFYEIFVYSFYDSDGNGWRYYDDKKGSKAEGNLVPHFEVISRMMEQDTYIPFEESAPLPGEEPAEESFASSVEIDPSELFGGN